jgi:hypothetical protein
MYNPIGFNFMFSVFPVIFIIVFLIVIAGFIASAYKGLKQYKRNNASPC